MTETTITILVNRKSDIEIIKGELINSKIQFPIYIFEYENNFQIQFVSDYEEWEIDTKILNHFTDCEFVHELEKGRKEIRLQINRQKEDFYYSENSINETKYLIRKTTKNPEKFNPNIKVLFHNEEKNYFINIVNGNIPSTGEEGFLLLTNFQSKNIDSNSEFFKDKLYKTRQDAFQSGYYKMQTLVDKDFSEFIESKKKAIRDLHKIPRKIVRDFINSCNKNDVYSILKNLDNSVVFEKRVRWETNDKIEGITQFEEYLKSPNQDLCSMNFKIRSSWNIKLPYIEIGVKYYPHTLESEKQEKFNLIYRDFYFTLDNNKITRITEERR